MRAIGIRSTPKGGFGNRLLNYINLRELSSLFGVPWFGPNVGDRRLVRGIHRPRRWPEALLQPVFFDREEILEEEFLERASDVLSNRRSVIMKPRLLTEALARFDFLPPRQLVRHRFSICGSHRRQHGKEAPIVLHLRGTDFATWQPGAVLEESFYRNALDLLAEQGLQDAAVRICTDDPEHPALEGLSMDLRRTGRLLEGPCDNPFQCDFAAMAQAQTVVSSPSTFAITAALVGHSSAIHSRKWIDSRIQKGDLFWRKIRNRTLRGHRLFAEV